MVKVEGTLGVRTQEPWKKTARLGTLEHLRETARERTQESSENQWKGGEFRRSGRKRSGRKRKEKG